MKLPWWLDWDFQWRDLSIAHRDSETDNCWIQVFALRCWCGTWFGCSDHWFCGTCDKCKED